jgi:hypothetical protein
MHPLRRDAMLTRPLLRAVPAALVAAACGAQAERGGCGGGVTCPAPLVRGTKDAVLIRCGLPAVWFAYGESTDAAGRYAFELEPLGAPPLGEALQCELRGGLPGFRPETVAVRFSRARADRPTTKVDLRQAAAPGA